MPDDFLREFVAAYHRAPRILHIGNIANNAYLNAKILNRNGYDCDVICYDYYHIMGCPEWEEVDFDGVIADHFRPDWTAVDLKGYQRPPWFAQGPREMCIEYLIARRAGQTKRAASLWRDLGWANKTRAIGFFDRPATASRSKTGEAGLDKAGAAIRRLKARIQPTALYYRSRSYFQRALSRVRTLVTRARHRPDAFKLTWCKLQVMADRRGESGYFLMALIAPFVMIGVALSRLPEYIGLPEGVAESKVLSRIAPKPRAERLPAWMTEWPAQFKTAFADRPDQLTANDVAPFMWTIPEWKRLFEHYDIVQAYSTDVMLPMLAEKHPYVGFEHGTLRVFTLDDTGVCRLTSLGYHLADHVLITNGDCLDYAQKIKVKSYTPMIHPFDDEFMGGVAEERSALRNVYGAPRLFLCPLRHDWAIKGTDKYIHALPGIADRIGRDFKVIMTRWGGQVAEAERLAETLGVADLIAWIEPLNRVQLVRHLKSVDVVFDQIALPCFGGTAPQAIATGQPVIMSYDPESTKWLIPDAAPILTAWSADQIVEAVVAALDPAWRAQYRETARQWYDTHHSARQVVHKHSVAYLDAGRAVGLLPPERIPA